MRKTVHVLATAAALCLAAGAAQAVPVASASIHDAAQSTSVVEKTAYIVGGRRYCFYFNGWHGPGWYRCGFAWRRGFGWGGIYGWRGWEYGPAQRRFGHFGRGHRHFREGRTTTHEGNRLQGHRLNGNRLHGDRMHGNRFTTEHGRASMGRETNGRGFGTNHGPGGGPMNSHPSGGPGGSPMHSSGGRGGSAGPGGGPGGGGGRK